MHDRFHKLAKEAAQRAERALSATRIPGARTRVRPPRLAHSGTAKSAVRIPPTAGKEEA